MIEPRIDILKNVVNRKYKVAAKINLEVLSNNHIEFWTILTDDSINNRSVISITQFTFQNELQKHQDISEVITDLKILVCEQ